MPTEFEQDLCEIITKHKITEYTKIPEELIAKFLFKSLLAFSEIYEE